MDGSAFQQRARESCILAARKTLGGKSWEKIGPVWYGSLTGFGPAPDMRMKAFADRTRQAAHTMYSGTPAVAAAVDQGWKHVGL